METAATGPEPEHARSMLAAADQSRSQLIDSLRLPGELHVALALGVAVQVGTAAYGISQQTAGGLAVVLTGMAVFGLVAAFILHRFRRVNGARVDGLSSQVLLGSGTLISLLYLGSLGAAIWAAFESAWWLVTVSAVVGGASYAVGVREWWKSYRHDPVARTRGASPRVLAGLGAVACVGLLTLLLVG
ncbi:hypothetical protein [Ornithinimicrobium cryptoxanthini]|uniref:Uncharacterized protein n=1 Tax=Ornithinimicrobium cryptoxanthini TaxID=2934161 RepID=A0ABY4YL81_9MICO|nr:hypothetical protein [Ornithinimicrobium cryptoxanthini]USQ77387.1 hypothetical protein NF557_05590 [Ornithinimicrobium cryptoxanthini]